MKRQGKAVARIVFAVRRDDGINGQDQRLEASALGALHQLIRVFPLVPQVELHPQPAAGFLGNLFHRSHGAGSERERYLRRRRSLREFQFAVVPAKPRRAGRCDGERHAHRLAEERGLHAALRHINERAGAQLYAFEAGTVVAQRNLVLGAPVDELEDTSGQAAACRFAQIRDVVATSQRRHDDLPDRQQTAAVKRRLRSPARRHR
jgi:hypothetical protein